MENSYQYTTSATWTNGRRGTIHAEGIGHSLDFSAPPEFQGTAGIWTPEHFLVAAVATCFITTFRAIAEFSKFEIGGLQVTAEGVLSKGEGGFKFTNVIVRPTLTILREEDRERGLKLMDKAEHACLVSRSLNSQISLEPTVIVGGAVSA